MPDFTLCLAFHCHQPVGNFEHVIADAFARCYHPMLEVLAEHPTIRFGLHWSGILYDWAAHREPATLELLHTLVDRGQVELLGGGYYEPLLPLLPPEDVRGQLCAMQDYVHQVFGQMPAGFWLTERVWEPQLPRLCASTGLRYTMTDDTHFRAAGLPLDALVGYYLTEDGGHPLAVFPVDKDLRYWIPFREPRESIARLRDVAERHPGSALTYGDDGEKFGLWPGTYEWVYTEHYLHRFCEALEAEADWLTVGLPEWFRATHAPTGRLYLPTASYDEMETWVLDAEDQLAYDRVMHADLPAEQRRFLRGGFFRNFLRKYPEANLMHKRMIQVSRRIADLGDTATEEMRRELWQGQCSCPYWHGQFGGLYLNGIRQANHAHLIRAGLLADEAAHPAAPWVDVMTGDFDCDGVEEVSIRGRAMELWIDPADGGTICLLDDRHTSRMLSDVLTRRPEGYHAKVLAATHAPEGTAPRSIHDTVSMKEDGLDALLHYDAHTRACFRDRVLGAGLTLEDAVAGRLPESHGSGVPVPGITVRTQGATATASLEIPIPTPEPGVVCRLLKTYRYDDADARLEVNYGASSSGAGPFRFATELNLTLLASDAPDRHLRVTQDARETDTPLGDRGEHARVSGFTLIDDYARASLRVAVAPHAMLWHYPVETVSNSEYGFERTYQGTAFLLIWDWDPATGDAPTLNLSLHPHA